MYEVWIDGLGYDLFYLSKSKTTRVWKMVHDLQEGIPKVIVSDGSGEQTGAK
jgi:hypothetical protein